ncbi:MAG: hypothetical protein WBZ36_16740, partial [Candidatus Nitrosopolaris sp.]
MVSKYYPKFFNLKSAIAKYYRTRRFKLDITKYLFRKDSDCQQITQIINEVNLVLPDLSIRCVDKSLQNTIG